MKKAELRQRIIDWNGGKLRERMKVRMMKVVAVVKKKKKNGNDDND